MARWAIRHLTSYRYSVAVRLAPHVLRLTPRPDRIELVTRQLQIWPEPLQCTEQIDSFGNACTQLQFDSTSTTELRVESYVELETPGWVGEVASVPPLLPWTAADGALLPYAGYEQHPDVLAFAQSLARQVDHQPLAFLELLNRELHGRTERQLRMDGAAQAPEQTLASARGACRDLSVLFLAACRSLGIAGRFVSGYQGQEQTPDGRRHLHAWAEVWLPGTGFIGWDPMHGVPVGPGHVALAAAPEQSPTMPIEGGYYFDGPSLTSTLDYSIEMRSL